MSQKQSSWKMWVGIILVLIVTGFVAVLWPTIIGSLIDNAPTLETPGLVVTDPNRGPTVEVFEFTVPAEAPVTPPGIEPGQTIYISGPLLMMGLGALFFGLIIGGGITFFIVSALFSRLVRNNAGETEDYQQHVGALEQREKDRLKVAKDERPSDSTQQHDYKTWDAWATGAVILLFMAFLALTFARTVWPDAENSSLIVGLVSLVTIIVLAFWLRPSKVEAVNDTDYGGIPWDTITVVATGLLVVGLGIGLIVFLNVPA